MRALGPSRRAALRPPWSYRAHATNKRSRAAAASTGRRRFRGETPLPRGACSALWPSPGSDGALPASHRTSLQDRHEVRGPAVLHGRDHLLLLLLKLLLLFLVLLLLLFGGLRGRRLTKPREEARRSAAQRSASEPSWPVSPPPPRRPSGAGGRPGPLRLLQEKAKSGQRAVFCVLFARAPFAQETSFRISLTA